jgi:hypothetical protein
LVLITGCGGTSESAAARTSAATPTATPTPEKAGRNPANEFPIRFDGFGPVKVGMKPADAMKVFGNLLTENRWDDESECYYLNMKEDPENSPAFMVNDGTVARVDISTAEYQTEAGAKVGDTEARIKEIYGPGVDVSPHEYVDGHYLTMTTKDGKYAIVFETDGKVVTYIRAGRPPEVGYIEGCA